MVRLMRLITNLEYAEVLDTLSRLEPEIEEMHIDGKGIQPDELRAIQLCIMKPVVGFS